LKTFLDFFVAFAVGFGLRLCQLLPKIHEQELEILDGVKPALIPSSPLLYVGYLRNLLDGSFTFGEVGLFWDTNFRVLQGMRRGSSLSAAPIWRGFRRQI
jgi:hypothetical protein